MKRALLLPICLLCVGLVGCVNNIKGVAPLMQYEEAGKYSVGNFSYEAAEVKKVRVDWIAGEVCLLQSNASTLQVKETGELTSDQQLHYLWEEGVLTIRYCASGYSGTFPVNSKELTLEIPAGIDVSVDSVSGGITLREGIFGEVKLDTTSGNISLGSVASDACRLNTVSGSMQAEELVCGENLKADTTSGRILIQRLEAPIADLGTVSGDLNLELFSGQSVKLETTSGAIKLMVEAGQDIELESVSGSIELQLGDGISGASVDFDSSSGTFHGDGYKMEGGRHVFGDGTCQIQVETTSGNLTIK